MTFDQRPVYAVGRGHSSALPLSMAKLLVGMVLVPVYLGNFPQSRAFSRAKGCPLRSLSMVSTLVSSAPSGMVISAIFSHFSAAHSVGLPSASTALIRTSCPTSADATPREMSVLPASPFCPSAPLGMPRSSSGFSAVPPMLAVASLPAGRVVTVPI